MSSKGSQRLVRMGTTIRTIAIAVLGSGLAQNTPADEISKTGLNAPAQLDRQQAIGEYIWSALPFLSDRPLASLRQLGPFREEVLTEPNPYTPNQPYEFRRLHFHGMTVYGRVIDRKAARLLHPVTVEITSPHWILAKGIRVGLHVREVQRTLGMATSIKRDSLLYQGETDSLEFHLKDGRVSVISLLLYDG